MSRGSNHAIEQEELMAYLDGELSAERAAAAVSHLSQCQECQKLASDLRRLSRSFVDWEVEPVLPQEMRKIGTALDAWREQSTKAPIVRNRIWLYFFPRIKEAVFGRAFVLACVCLVLWLGGAAVRHSKENMVFNNVAHSIGDESRGSPGEFRTRGYEQTRIGVGDGSAANESSTSAAP
jgi:anti-sigma factor RsiW